MDENLKIDGSITNINLEDEMKKSYLDYAMSVIVSRALPDVRDGMKPVHRRIIYSMNNLGIYPDKPHRKSARIVGDVLGKYHPHGDSAVYDAMVRLAQDFSTRYLLVDGHGNFGSVDGDSAAAMRYTEARMSKLSLHLLRDIDKETVDYQPNFDESDKEPIVLPSRFPNLLVNGSSGIAVGMATSIPPHNLDEVIDAIVKMIENPSIEIEEIIKYIKGPDFPTGATILGKEDIRNAYRTGRGKVTVRAKSFIEESGKGRSSIIITEIPYQVNKARVIEKIAELVRDKKIEGIADLRDESNREGMRIVIDVKREVNPNIVLNNLYKYTQLQDTFSIIMLALVDNIPRVLNIKEVIKHYLDHQYEIIVRRTRYDLNKSEERAHILEGLRIALDRIEEIIETIRGSNNTQEAREKLIENFGLSEKQAQAILDMRLQRLTGLERGKIEEEYQKLLLEIKNLKEILASDEKIYGIIKDELLEIRDEFGDERRTEIIGYEGEVDIEDLIEEEEVVINLTHLGYIKRMPEDTYKIQRRGGRGISGANTREEDFVESIFTCSTHDDVLFFTSKGKVYNLKGYEIPEASRQARGTAIINLLELESDEKINTIIPIKEFVDDSYLTIVTKLGLIKRVHLEAFKNIRKNGLIVIRLREEDELLAVRKSSGEDEVIVITRNGFAIRFDENESRVMGRTAMGVKALNLKDNDYVVGVDLIRKDDLEDKELLVISENGYGKRTSIDEYTTQKRGGIGLKTYHVRKRTGKLVCGKIVSEEDEIIITSINGTIIRLNVSDISQLSRATQGVRLMKIAESDKVSSVAKLESE
ncbi:MAG: DNA gyrase subunit A [Andreesenia angusta]|nr:DNA gyrase subunit A [Andreesenia angusta]